MERNLKNNASYIARCAQLAMALEVSACPKPGNVDRDHNYADTRFEHFLASAISVYPVMERAARSERGVGKLILRAVEESRAWQRGGNTHFGAFILLVPLVMAAGRADSIEELRTNAAGIANRTDTQDAINLYRAFSAAGVRVKPVVELDLSDESSIRTIRKRGLTLFDLMKISSGYDLIASEFVNGFPRAFAGAALIEDKITGMGINDAVVYTYLRTLAKNPDTFVETKSGRHKAQEVSMRALAVLSDIEKYGFDRARQKVREFDRQLIRERVNPGSTA
ncbi:MAG TPA: fumarate hydratase, partial [Candidatus Methanoperedenaceae archaeon]|nr:fumarate hydratase [Candidatus Methanoperedenaceae archaeon]